MTVTTRSKSNQKTPCISNKPSIKIQKKTLPIPLSETSTEWEKIQYHDNPPKYWHINHFYPNGVHIVTVSDTLSLKHFTPLNQSINIRHWSMNSVMIHSNDTNTNTPLNPFFNGIRGHAILILNESVDSVCRALDLN